MESKVTKREFKKKRKSDYGDMFDFDVEFENGDKGQYAAKSENPNHFIVGTVCEYTKETKSGNTNGKDWSFDIIKPVKKEFVAGGGGFKQKPVKVWALEVARKYELSCTNLEEHGFDKVVRTATWAAKLADTYSREAIESAFTAASALSIKFHETGDGVPLKSSEILEAIKEYDAFIKS